MDEPVCDYCREGFDRSALTDCHFISSRTVAWALGPGYGLHIHNAVIADRQLLTWRGFLAYKTARSRLAIRNWWVSL